MPRIPTVTLVLKKKYASDIDGYINILTWVPGENKPVPKSTGFKVPETSWDAINEFVLKNHPDAYTINRQIQKDKDRIEKLLKDDLERGMDFTRENITRHMKPPKVLKGEFLQFYHDHIVYLETKFSKGYCNHFTIEWKHLCKVAPACSFKDISVSFLEQYEMSLSKCAKTTLNTKMKRLKEVIDKAIAQGKIKTEAIAGYNYPGYAAPDRPYLTLAQVQSIGNAIYKKQFDYNPTLKKVACYFLIECYSGIRFSDWHRFTVEKLVHNRALKVRAKKNGEIIYLPFNIFKRLGKIVDYVIDNNIIFDQNEGRTNGLLKVMAIQLKLGIHVTTHIGRHTCGTLLGEMGYDIKDIADVLGISPQTALTYTKTTKQGLKNAFKKYGGL